LEAGKIRHAGCGATVIGKVTAESDADLVSLAGLLTEAGINTSVSSDVLGLLWDKLLVNIGINALTALSGLRNGQLLEFRETEEILEAAVREAFQVAQALGIALSHNDPVTQTKEVCRLTAANTSSMLQDVRHKRKTEIEMMNGAIVREGQRLGIATPVNNVLTNLLSVIEKNY
jgi:2-dehydropantoate 2-reductase